MIDLGKVSNVTNADPFGILPEFLLPTRIS